MLQSENMEALRSFRHDMKRHFAEISVLASKIGRASCRERV